MLNEMREMLLAATEGQPIEPDGEMQGLALSALLTIGLVRQIPAPSGTFATYVLTSAGADERDALRDRAPTAQVTFTVMLGGPVVTASDVSHAVQRALSREVSLFEPLKPGDEGLIRAGDGDYVTVGQFEVTSCRA